MCEYIQICLTSASFLHVMFKTMKNVFSAVCKKIGHFKELSFGLKFVFLFIKLIFKQILKAVVLSTNLFLKKKKKNLLLMTVFLPSRFTLNIYPRSAVFQQSVSVQLMYINAFVALYFDLCSLITTMQLVHGCLRKNCIFP